MTDAHHIRSPEPLDADDDFDDLPEADLPTIADLALRRMADAARRGRVLEALRWQRLHEALSAQLDRSAEADRQAEAARSQAHAAEAHQARIQAALPPNATFRDRMEAELQAMIDGTDTVERPARGEKVEEVESLFASPLDPPPIPPPDLPPDPLSLSRAERRRREKTARKRC